MTHTKNRLLAGIAFVAVLALMTQGRAEPPSGIDAAYQALVDNPKVKAAFDLIKADDAATFVEQKRITEIASPPYKEKVRAEYYLKRMQELGLKDATIDADSPVVQAAQKSVEAVVPGRKVMLAGASTDSNQPMSLGIPAVTIGGGGEGGNWHSVNEWYKPVNGYLGPQRALMAVLILQGLDGVTSPTLAVRPAK